MILFLAFLSACKPLDDIDCQSAAEDFAALCEGAYDEAAASEGSLCENYQEEYSCEDYEWSRAWFDCMGVATTCEDASVCDDAAFAAREAACE